MLRDGVWFHLFLLVLIKAPNIGDSFKERDFDFERKNPFFWQKIAILPHFSL